jgi:uncharacterized membrane protein YkvA (DUF1232 family)
VSHETSAPVEPASVYARRLRFVGVIHHWRQKARHLKRETYALYFAVRDPRVPWYAKVLAAGIVGYAFSPIDLIPDFIPVLGYFDELVLLPLGVLAVRAMIPEGILAECRERASRLEGKPRNWVGAGVIVAIWLALAGVGVYWLAGWFGWQ